VIGTAIFLLTAIVVASALYATIERWFLILKGRVDGRDVGLWPSALMWGVLLVGFARLMS
jgi:hypothetical protein